MISNVLKIYLRMLLRSWLEVAFWHHLASWPPGAPWPRLHRFVRSATSHWTKLWLAVAAARRTDFLREKETSDASTPSSAPECRWNTIRIEPKSNWGCSNWACFMMAMPLEKLSNDLLNQCPLFRQVVIADPSGFGRTLLIETYMMFDFWQLRGNGCRCLPMSSKNPEEMARYVDLLKLCKFARNRDSSWHLKNISSSWTMRNNIWSHVINMHWMDLTHLKRTFMDIQHAWSVNSVIQCQPI